MGGYKYGAAVGLCDIYENLAHNAHTVGVKSVYRLVKDKQRGITKQRHSNAYSLLHTQRAFLEFQRGVILHTNDFKHAQFIVLKSSNKKSWYEPHWING